ncbi:MAG: arginine deiminase family protein [Candidatus Thermoplasmatota archaeon]|nr:arginine deiminase family protein [Candidatus Thermoplasmatota archaeon]
MGGSHNRVKGSAIVREVSRDFEAALSSYFGTSAPDFVAATGSHASYVAALRAHGTEVEVLPELQGYPDCCFIEDTSVVIDDSAIILAPGHPSRIGEVESVTEHLAKTMEIQRLDGGTVDGGDIVFMDDAFLVGRSGRTNSEGIESLSKIIKSHGYNIEVVDVPESTLHLTTICSSPRPDTLVYSERDLSADDITMFAEDLIGVPHNEAYAANTLGYPDDKIIIAAGFPETRKRLLDSGFSITSVDMEPIMQADGSLTCLSVFTG